MPPDFVGGLEFLRPFVSSKSKHPEELFVHLTGGKLSVLTNSVYLEYDIENCELPDLRFRQQSISLLNAFVQVPSVLVVSKNELLFQWDNGQECLFDSRSPFSQACVGENTRMADATRLLASFWDFKEVTKVDRNVAKQINSDFSGNFLDDDLFLTNMGIVSRRSDSEKPWSSEFAIPLSNHSNRTRRFDRKAFLKVLRIATEINFSSSPVCFRHEHGRGMLVERTLAADMPNSGAYDV